MGSVEVLVAKAAEVVDALSPQTRLLKLAALRQAVDAAMVAALGELEEDPGPVYLDGGVDGAQWLSSRTEVHPAEAAALAGLGRNLAAMPATGAALEAGRIGTPKARLLESAREVPGFSTAEPGLVDDIVHVSLRTAKRIIGRFIADNRPASPGDPAANEVTLTPRNNGRWRLSGDLDAETAAVVGNELRRLADTHRDDDQGLSRARRTAMALLDMARRSVTLGDRGPGSRPELVLVADASLFGDIHSGRYEDGTPVSRQVFESLTCDATIRALLVNGSREPLDLGRSVRTASIGQRRAVAVRDRGCVYPGCDRPPDHCEVHHIRHWTKHGGPTDIANLCLLCRRHHTLTHVIGFTFGRRANGELIIYRPDGQPLQLLPRPRAA